MELKIKEITFIINETFSNLKPLKEILVELFIDMKKEHAYGKESNNIKSSI